MFLIGAMELAFLIFGGVYSLPVDSITAILNIIIANFYYFIFLLVLIISGILIALIGRNIENKRMRH